MVTKTWRVLWLYLGETGAVALGRGMQTLPACSPAGREPGEAMSQSQPLPLLTSRLLPPIGQT